MLRPLAGVVVCAALACAGCGEETTPQASSAAQAGTWRSLTSATLKRTEVAAARVGRFIYVLGGFEQQSGSTTGATERYDIERDTWRRVADMPVALNHAAGGLLGEARPPPVAAEHVHAAPMARGAARPASA